MELNVVNIEGKETGRTVDLPETIFGIEPNDHAIYLDVKQYLANQRQGTHKSKERAEVAGSTRKLHRQKGTGTARIGSKKSPLLRGGGRAFGPKPRDYSFKLNKKLKRLARLSALTYKAKKNAIYVVEDFTFETPKTKEFLAIQKNLGLNGVRSMFVLKERNKNIYLSSRNIQKSEVVIPEDLNTYIIMRAKTMVFTESAVAELSQFLNKKEENHE
ncbi:MAG: 50S ribosomal protein L4 [Marinilabiliaceae bacterium]|nr:50S ribosomal protein L4 [Marinilabiliaceae bacterium]